MPMKGRFPIRRTLQYLNQGNVVFKDSVKVMTVNYNTRGELGEGARKFVFFNIPQIQYKNPWVQIMMFKNMTPSPFLRFYLDSGEQVLVDVETKSNKEIMEHIRKILGKTEHYLAVPSKPVSMVPVTQEAESGRLLEPTRLRLQ
uniref:Small ribosomal subunit protein mS25 n=1 Tax=Cebus imitator TaxID=2715852 RepID=A0A2K5R4B5_CEBIM